MFYELTDGDGVLGGVCNGNTANGCIDDNAVCNDSVCQCVQMFTDIDGVCKAGELNMQIAWNWARSCENMCYAISEQQMRRSACASA